MVSQWDDEGEIDLLDFFAELTIYTSSSCLIGKRFRDGARPPLRRPLPRPRARNRRGRLRRPLRPDRELPPQRDESRAELVRLVQGIMDGRLATEPPPDDERDLLDVLLSIREEDGTPRFSADQVTGIFISMMFAGHHTTSTTASWMVIELLKHEEELRPGGRRARPALRGRRRGQLPGAPRDALARGLAQGDPPAAPAAHPVAARWRRRTSTFRDYTIHAGQMVGASPWVSNRIAEDFTDAGRFDAARYISPRDEEKENPWTWIPFGAGRHRCVGAAFALMQLKAIFSVLLLDWEFELAQPPESYRPDLSKMVIQLRQPVAVRYRRRSTARTGAH